ncbi:MAG: sensor histidine kinase, partial [Candidatus Saliniplasma sp.]
CIVTVEDDGKGIADDIKEKIFERGFKKGENAGSGLGMYLVKEIVESYGGSIDVKDSELGGARFDVILKRYSTV